MALPSLLDRVVVITGASQGLGAGLADDMHHRGLRLGLCARGQVPLHAEPGVLAESVDVRDEQAVDDFAHRVADRLGPIDLWINNAGQLGPVSFVRDLSWPELAEHLAVNVGGVVAGSRAFVRHLHRTGRPGVLVNITSGAAQAGYAGWAAYCSGKAAVDRITECLALEEREHGLRAYAVAPGVIDTQMQVTVRGMTEEQFPMVEKFRDLKRREAFNSPAFVSRHLLQIAFDPAARPDAVVLRVPSER